MPLMRLLVLDGTWAFIVIFGQLPSSDHLRTDDPLFSHFPCERDHVHCCSRSECFRRTDVRMLPSFLLSFPYLRSV
jgi:hypothetical protein